MQNLKKLFPYVTTMFTEDSNGVSRTKANQLKIDNANEIAKLMSKFHGIQYYDVDSKTVSTNGANHYDTQKAVVPSLDDFKVYSTVAKLKGESAILGNGIKTLNTIQDAINDLQPNQFELLGIIAPEASPVSYVKSQRTFINPLVSLKEKQFYELDNVEQLIASASEELLNRCIAKGINYHEALKNESAAATYGSVIHSNSMLRGMIEAHENKQPSESNHSSFIIVRTYKLGYEKADYEATLKEFEKKYEQLQGEKNGFLKAIKDEARLLQNEINAENLKLSQDFFAAIKKNEAETLVYNEQCAQMKSILSSELAKLSIVL